MMFNYHLRDNKGEIVDVKYIIYKLPHPPDIDQSCEDEPDMACPDTETPDMVSLCLENWLELMKRNPKE